MRSSFIMICAALAVTPLTQDTTSNLQEEQPPSWAVSGAKALGLEKLVASEWSPLSLLRNKMQNIQSMASTVQDKITAWKGDASKASSPELKYMETVELSATEELK